MNLNRNEIKSAIVGMVIGDGCLSKRYKNGEAYYQMNHNEKQYEYLLWKQDIISKITGSRVNPIDYTSNLDGKDYRMYHLGSNRHPIFTSLYNRFYQYGYKSVDEYLVKMITPLAFAIMYMDDGTFGKEGNRNESFYLCTQNFDYANQLLIAKSLKIKFDLNWNTNKVGKSKKGTILYRLRLAGKDNQKFIDIVKPYIEQIPCMIHKLSSYANTSKEVDIV